MPAAPFLWTASWRGRTAGKTGFMFDRRSRPVLEIRGRNQLESGELKLDGVDGQAFFAQIINDVQTGFFADPIYGGNRDMVGWKMIGYPGARYNYLDWVSRHNEPFPLPPVSMTGRAEWTPKTR